VRLGLRLPLLQLPQELRAARLRRALRAQRLLRRAARILPPPLRQRAALGGGAELGAQVAGSGVGRAAQLPLQLGDALLRLGQARRARLGRLGALCPLRVYRLALAHGAVQLGPHRRDLCFQPLNFRFGRVHIRKPRHGCNRQGCACSSDG